MKLEDQVCSLELAKKLKELGVRQESLWYWNTYRDGSLPHICQRPVNGNSTLVVGSAFTVAELGEMLPMAVSMNRRKKHPEHAQWYWSCIYASAGNLGICSLETTEANARAKCLTHLIEKGVVKP